MSDPVKIGDIYDVKSGAYFCVVKSEPYANAQALAEEHWPDGQVYPTLIDPSNPALIKRPKRPPFPKRGLEIAMDSKGYLGQYVDGVVHIPADEVDGLPWRWSSDGTLVTDGERQAGR